MLAGVRGGGKREISGLSEDCVGGDNNAFSRSRPSRTAGWRATGPSLTTTGGDVGTDVVFDVVAVAVVPASLHIRQYHHPTSASHHMAGHGLPTNRRMFLTFHVVRTAGER